MDESAAFEKKCKILLDDALGRYVVAATPIKEGETILLECPILILPLSGDKRCANCFKLTDTNCRICKIFPLCSHCPKHNEFDCQTLTKLPAPKSEELQNRNDVYGPLKCLLLNANTETKEYFEKFIKMEAHIKERRNTDVWLENDKNVVQPILKAELNECLQTGVEITADLLQQICGILDANCFEIRAPDEAAMRGVYLRGSILNHECVANATCAIDEQYRMKIYANRYIAQGETVSNCYVNILLGTDERRNILQMGKYFHCTCARCEDPTEMNSHMSSFVCGKCAAASREGGFIVKQQNKWQCMKCDSTLKPEYVQSLIERAKEEIFHAKDDIYHYELLMAKLSRILHRNHYLMVDIKQNIAAILRSILQNMIQRPGRKVYERKVRLCHDILAVLKIVQPGISRLKGIALYELCNTTAEMHRLRYTEKELNEEQLAEQLQQCELLMREAVRNLIYEPVGTPEGMLTRTILKEIKDSQNDMKELKQKQNSKDEQDDESNSTLVVEKMENKTNIEDEHKTDRAVDNTDSDEDDVDDDNDTEESDDPGEATSSEDEDEKEN